MAKRLKVGLIYSYNKNWVAGSYYILNLIQSLNKLEDKDKPELTILSFSSDNFHDIKAIDYPYINFHPLSGKDLFPTYSIFERGINKLFRIAFGKIIINKKNTKKRLTLDLDILFPATNHVYFSKIKNRIFWIPDFQEHFLPQFFSEEEITSRKTYQKELSEKSGFIIFSSNDALGHFKTFFPQSKTKTFVLPFAVTHPIYEDLSTDLLFKKYTIDRPYFFCPNQVWAHKNHITVLKSIKLLKDKGEKNVLVLFTGKEFDNRNPDVFNNLKKYINENQIQGNVKFLGFIDREEQLQLMNNSICVIQPSLFEGWSTVIEDAKAMNQYIIASELPVHKEQIQQNVTFFDPKNDKQLAGYLFDFMNQNPKKIKIDYTENISKFGKRFIEITNEIVTRGE